MDILNGMLYSVMLLCARAVVETVGIKDIRSKALRSNNPCNVVRATIDGLKQLRTIDEVAAIREKSAKEILG